MLRNLPVRSFRGKATRAELCKTLEMEFDGKVTLTDVPSVRLMVESSNFNHISKKEQIKKVLDKLPDDWIHCVQVETKADTKFVDHQVRRVVLNNAHCVTEKIVRYSPQRFLDNAVTQFEVGNGALASESVWLCGSLALKNFGIQNGIDPKTHLAKSQLVDFIRYHYGKRIAIPWVYIQQSHSNSYEDNLMPNEIRDSMEQAEEFCNLLHKYHQLKTFDYKKFIHEDDERDKTKTELSKKRFERLFRIC